MRRKLRLNQNIHIEISRRASAEDKADLAVTQHLVEKSEALHQIRGLLALANAALLNRHLVDLTVVLSRLFLIQVFAPAFCV